MRNPYEASFEVLRQRVSIVGEPRPAVLRCPREDDDEPGPSVCWQKAEDVRLEALTLPGLYVGHTRMRRVSFVGSDLHLSTFHWSVFRDCSFASCDLSRTDLRACAFSRCSFHAADLSGADLRGSTFARCDFHGARLDGAVLFRRPGRLWTFARGILSFPWHQRDQRGVPLSDEQRARVAWTDQPGRLVG